MTPLALPAMYSPMRTLGTYWEAFHRAHKLPIPVIIGGEKANLCVITNRPYILLIDTTPQQWAEFVEWCRGVVAHRMATTPRVVLYGDSVILKQSARNGSTRAWLTVISPEEMDKSRAEAYCLHYWQASCGLTHSLTPMSR